MRGVVKMTSVLSLVLAGVAPPMEPLSILPAPDQNGCVEEGELLGWCTGGLDVGATETTTSPGYDEWVADTGYDAEAAADAWQAFVNQQNDLCDAMSEARDQCFYFAPADEDEPDSAPALSLSISDLISFTPITGSISGQPTGFAVVGIPATFSSDAASHTQTGALFGMPVTVQWTPVYWTYDFGDGTTSGSSSPGAPQTGDYPTWVDTPTSHRYQDRTDRVVTLSIEFIAEVDFGSGFFLVPGSLVVDAPPLDVRVFEVTTVLVQGDCITHPSGPGCP